MSDLDIGGLATELMAAKAQATTLARPSASHEDFDMNDAYAVGAELTRRFIQQGHHPNGRKIGFTNPALWPRLNLDGVIWAYTYDNTVQYVPDNQLNFALASTVAPKIEPEIVFKLRAPLSGQGLSALQILEATEWLALGFEIVDCNYANWRFKAADMVADFGFHTALLIGETRSLAGANLEELAQQLQNLKVKLFNGSEVAAEGAGSNVMGNPALSLGALAELVSRQETGGSLAAGEVVTTGTLTDAMFVTKGETWKAHLEGLDLPDLTVTFE